MDESTELTAPVDGETTSGLLRETPHAPGGVVMLGGAVGGLDGPSGVYVDLAERLHSIQLVSLRLRYRHLNHLRPCVEDALAGVHALVSLGAARVALIGWSFSGAVAIAAGASSADVVGVAAVASQTYGTDAVSRLAPRSLLLLHGTSDVVLSDAISRQLYAEAREPKRLVLFPDDGHGIERHRAEMLELLYEWCKAVLLHPGMPETGPESTVYG